MGSGEGDAAELARQLLATSKTLDAFTRCRAEVGCEVMVHLSGDGVCVAHGAGRDGIPEYMTSADDGAFIYVRHLDNIGGDCE